MRSTFDYDPDCFFCRILRSFAITGLGAGVSGGGALYFGVPRTEAVYWAIVGGIVLTGIVINRRLRRGL